MRHDAGRAAVTVYHRDGTEVMELPPRYGGTPLPHPLRLAAKGVVRARVIPHVWVQWNPHS